jgi:hypothetical protein
MNPATERPERPLDLLFVMTNPVYVRNFESTLRELVGRGHSVHVAFELEKQDDHGQLDLVQTLVAELDGISWGHAPPRPAGVRAVAVRALRRGRDYLRFLGEGFSEAHELRRRAARPAPHRLEGAATRLLASRRRLRTAIDAVLSFALARMPADAGVHRFLAERRPDAVVVTPLTAFGSAQPDFILAARRLGIPSAFCAFSWDNLTTKSIIHAIPDLVTVWNEPQLTEAVELHGVPAERVVVTGAPAYDHWFDWRPRSHRAEFCERVGLPGDGPFLLYVGSSRFIAPDEADFVRWWLSELRARGGEPLADVGVLVRPHPFHAARWLESGLASLPGVAVYPANGADPRDERSRTEYYDSIHHAAAVVGLNTSALIESAIVGRSVHSLLTSRFRPTQEGTMHFHHLLEAGGGLLNVADTVEAHFEQLGAALTSPGLSSERNIRFVTGFVRPHGLEFPATPRLVAAIERVAASRPVNP